MFDAVDASHATEQALVVRSSSPRSRKVWYHVTNVSHFKLMPRSYESYRFQPTKNDFKNLHKFNKIKEKKTLKSLRLELQISDKYRDFLASPTLVKKS